MFNNDIKSYIQLHNNISNLEFKQQTETCIMTNTTHINTRKIHKLRHKVSHCFSYHFNFSKVISLHLDNSLFRKHKHSN